VAQLNSTPDYGSGGSRFESWQGHEIKKPRSKKRGFFIAEISQQFQIFN
jgi:hypothetical protein